MTTSIPAAKTRAAHSAAPWSWGGRGGQIRRTPGVGEGDLNEDHVGYWPKPRKRAAQHDGGKQTNPRDAAEIAREPEVAAG